MEMDQTLIVYLGQKHFKQYRFSLFRRNGEKIGTRLSWLAQVDNSEKSRY
jgi:hypothetical protein